MSKLCKCTHNNKQHFRKSFYGDKSCRICLCESYVSQNNKSHLVSLVLDFSSLIGIFIFIGSILSIILTNNIIINADGTPGLFGDVLGHTMVTLFLGGSLIANCIWLFAHLMGCALADYRRPTKSLDDRVESYPLD